MDKSPAQRYHDAVIIKCPMRRGRPHRYEPSGYCSDCAAKRPQPELVDA